MKYSEKVARRICDQLAEGKSLRTICKAADMPAKGTVFVWLRDKPAFAALYALAHDDQTDGYMDEIVAIADGCKPNKESIAKAKLQIYAREKYCAKLRPKKYGEKVTQELTGPGGGAVQIARIERVIVRPTDPDA